MRTQEEAGAGTARGPVRQNERALAPDLARGAMLLFIALANGVGVALGGPGFEAAPRGLERLVNAFLLTFVHARAYPVFAVMFGYGLVQLSRRQEAAGAPTAAVRAVLLRRNAWLVGFGFLHAAFLYFGDFLGAYGLVGIVATLALLHRSDRVHRIVLWLWALSVVHLLVLAVRVAAHLAGGPPAVPAAMATKPVASLVAPDYLRSIGLRLGEWPAHTATVLPVIVIVWLGIWAGRRRLLEEPFAHRRLLIRVAAVGLGIAFIGGLPQALASAGLLPTDAAGLDLIFLLHQVSGMFAGPGYVALFGVATIAVARSGRSAAAKAAAALAALGQRSLSAYLFQSVAWLLIFAPFALTLSQSTSSPLLTGCAVAGLVWLLSLVLARLFERRGHRGPAEELLRRLTYGGRPSRRPKATVDVSPDQAGKVLLPRL